MGSTVGEKSPHVEILDPIVSVYEVQSRTLAQRRAQDSVAIQSRQSSVTTKELLAIPARQLRKTPEVRSVDLFVRTLGCSHRKF
jgi:hypothetical protein